jgi:altronate dehydratase
MSKDFIIMDKNKDNVATALLKLRKNQEIDINDSLKIKLNKSVKMGHKFALMDIPEGGKVIKYGQVIGIAKRDIKKGDRVHRQIESPYVVAFNKVNKK